MYVERWYAGRMLRSVGVFAFACLALAPGCRSSAEGRAPRARAGTAPSSPRPAGWYPWLAATAPRPTIHDRFAIPAGCRRARYPEGSFPDWVQHLPLQPEGARATDFRGDPLTTRMEALALVDVDIFPRGQDLQQCADYGLRLGFEYLARFYPDRRVTWRLQSGKPYTFSPGAADRARTLHHLFAWLGTFGLKSYFPAPARTEYRPGDILVGNSTGAIGHAVVVHDVVRCGAERRYLVSQSWIPAQTPHIPKIGAEAYSTRAELDAFIRDVTGDTKVWLRSLPGIPAAEEL
jgi:hypothetical protein